MRRTRFRPAFSILALLLLALAARAGDEPFRPPLTADRIEPTEQWFGCYIQGKKMGYGRTTLAREGGDYVLRTEMHLSIQAMGKAVKMEMDEVKRFAGTAPFAFRGGESRFAQGPIGRTVSVQPGAEGKLAATIVEAGQTRRMDIDAPDYTLADELSQQLWIAAGRRAVGDKLASRSFDMMQLTSAVTTLELTRAEETVLHGVRTKHYTGKLHHSLQGDVGTIRFAADGEMLSMTAGGMFEMRSEPKDVAQQIEKGGDLFVQNMVKPDRPLGKPTEIRLLVLEVTGEGAEHIPAGPNQTVEKREGGILLRIGVDAPVEATEDEIAENLKETVEFPVKHEAIVKLAAGAVGDAATPREKVDALVRFVAKYVEDELRPEPLTVLDVVKDKRGDCAEHSILFTTLARAVGIPARSVSGLGYMGDQFQAFGGHAWAEVVLDGKWVPVDPTWNETKLDAGHIRIGPGLEGMTTFAWVMGRVELKVLKVESDED
jgi:hypothetical protein